MADLRKKSFVRSSENISANYNYTDVAEGTGVLKLYGANTIVTGGTTTYILTSQPVYSAGIVTSVTNAATYTYNFDLSAFNLPRTAKGTAYVNVTLGHGNSADTTYLTARVKKWDGATETNISSEVTSVTETTSGTYEFLLPLPLTQTNIKKGEILRLTIKLVKVGANGNDELGHDPQNRAGAIINPATQSVTSALIFYCPFRVDA